MILSDSVVEDKPEGNHHYHHPNKRDHNYRDILLFILSHAYKIARCSVEALLQRLDGPQSENILILIKEELSRLESSRWKRFLQKNYRNNKCFLPYSEEVINMDKMDECYHLPTNQMDGTRRDIQVFLLFRSLYKKISRLIVCGDDYDASRQADYDNLFSTISDKDFLCVDELSLMSTTLVMGSSFDMHGKRFLDVKRIPIPSSGRLSKDGSSDAGSTSDTRDISVKVTSPNGMTRSRNSWGSSILGFGSNEKNQKKNGATGAAPVATTSSTATVSSESSPSREKLLFVQDQEMLLLISCDKQDPRSGMCISHQLMLDLGW